MRVEILSFLYRKERRRVINRVYKRQEREGRPHDLEEAVEIGDKRLKQLNTLGSFLWYDFSIPSGREVRLYDLLFPSPLTLAAFKDDLEVIDIWLRLGLGGAIIKTLMKEKRDGNPRPRLQEVFPYGMPCFLNAMGLPGKAREEKLDDIAASSVFAHGRPIGISIGGSSLVEYGENFDVWRQHLGLHHYLNQFLEINISCPNTPEGQQITKHPELLEELLMYIRHRSNVVVGVKLSPDQSNGDLLMFADLVKGFQRTYVNLGSTSYRICEEVDLPKDALSTGGGGLSGPLLYFRTLWMVDLVAPRGIPIIATGGINSAEKIIELQNHGATLVGMATAVVKDMYCIPLINKKLKR